MTSHVPGTGQALVVVRTEGDDVVIAVAKGQPAELRSGPGFSVYERRRGPDGKEIEEFITVIPASEPTLHAVTDEQFNAWKGKRLIGKPMHLHVRERP